MKGFGIILVIMGHALQGNPQFDENFAFRIIYSFHMPLFFFISGYLLQVSLEKHPLAPISFVLKKARTLVVPFLSWYLIFGVWTGMASNVSWHEYVHRLIYSPDFGYWFLWVLFLCFAAILPVAWLQQRIDPRWRPGLIALSWLTLYLLRQTHTGFLGLHLLKVDYFYFAVGFFICCWRKQLSFFQRWWPEICVVGFLLLVPYWRRVGEMPFMPYLRENFPAKAEILRDTFEYSLALMGIGCVAQIVKALLSGPIGRWLAWIGTYTLDIYVIHLHTFLFCPFVVILSSHRGDSFGIATAVAWGIFASLAISFCLIRRSVILKFLFLGIHDSRKSDPVAAGRVALGEVGFSS